ncbi:MAG: FAD-binding protein, partial [SAR324 cluster bacterium]|nr:FAD-binding protein [SAR324 cluster bacterium]
MHATLNLVLTLDQADNPEEQRNFAAKSLQIEVSRITGLRLRKRSLDARQQNIKVNLQFDVYWDEPLPESLQPQWNYPSVRAKPRVIIVGCGPAGMFAALRLIELGLKPVILERGKTVRDRRRDLAEIQRKGLVNPDSNYCFGEGGAGTYSDGKLYTRANKRGNIKKILETFVAHGAHPDIMVDAHPHIGSNKLPDVVVAMRESILGAGGEIHFESRVTDFLMDRNQHLRGVVLQNGQTLESQAVILATGHSARDIFRLLHSHQILLESKSFALGVRIEHPQALIDEIQYHAKVRDPRLPPASYRLAVTLENKGIFSFCMCPGGFIIPAATEPGEVVVNGMSLSRRDSAFANSGLVVSVDESDLTPWLQEGPLAGIAYQKALEQRAFQIGGGHQKAPGQRVTDFMTGNISTDLPACSYKPGLTSAPIHELLPDVIVRKMRAGLRQFEKKMKGYLTAEAVMVGVESRTSSPVTIPRNSATLEHPTVAGLYPCGEGAGYAGGIVSAAMDGMNV